MPLAGAGAPELADALVQRGDDRRVLLDEPQGRGGDGGRGAGGSAVEKT